MNPCSVPTPCAVCSSRAFREIQMGELRRREWVVARSGRALPTRAAASPHEAADGASYARAGLCILFLPRARTGGRNWPRALPSACLPQRPSRRRLLPRAPLPSPSSSPLPPSVRAARLAPRAPVVARLARGRTANRVGARRPCASAAPMGYCIVACGRDAPARYWPRPLPAPLGVLRATGGDDWRGRAARARQRSAAGVPRPGARAAVRTTC